MVVPAASTDQMIYLLADRFVAQAQEMDLKVTRPDLVATLVTMRAMDREALEEMETEASLS